MPLGQKKSWEEEYYHRRPAKRAERTEEILKHTTKELERIKKGRDILYNTLTKMQRIETDNPPTKEELEGYGDRNARLLRLEKDIIAKGLDEYWKVK